MQYGWMCLNAQTTFDSDSEAFMNTENIRLTEREEEVLQHILAESTNAQIASQLNISQRTVETHRKNLFKKTGARSIVGLVKYGLMRKIIAD